MKKYARTCSIHMLGPLHASHDSECLALVGTNVLNLLILRLVSGAVMRGSKAQWRSERNAGGEAGRTKCVDCSRAGGAWLDGEGGGAGAEARQIHRCSQLLTVAQCSSCPVLGLKGSFSRFRDSKAMQHLGPGASERILLELTEAPRHHATPAVPLKPFPFLLSRFCDSWESSLISREKHHQASRAFCGCGCAGGPLNSCAAAGVLGRKRESTKTVPTATLRVYRADRAFAHDL